MCNLVSLIDLPPTMLDTAWLPTPDQMQGCSLLPLLPGDAMNWPTVVFILISESRTGRTIQIRRSEYPMAAPGADPLEDAGAAGEGADSFAEPCRSRPTVNP